MGEDRRLGLEQVGDDPITRAREDRLNRGPFARRSADLIRIVAEVSPSLVAGLIGPWGGGKTSTMAMIAEELAQEPSWSVVAFNPWELSDLGSLVAEFFTTLRSAIGDDTPAREALSKYANKVAPFVAIVPMFGATAATAIRAAGDQLLGDTSLAAQRAKLEKALGKLDAKILVLIDDVDRLQGDELTTVLKLVRLVGRLPNISYVLAYDEVTLLDVLGGTDVGGRDPHRALAYLDKIVQLRLDLPPVSTSLIRKMVDQGLSDVTTAHGITLKRAEEERLESIYIDSLEPSLTEPRDIKRFFGQVDAMYSLLGREEVDFVDFFLITFMRVFYPAVHREVLRSKAELTGTKLELEKTTDKQRIAQWKAKLKDKHGLDDEAVERAMGILGAMFPRLQRFSFAGPSARPIGSAEYFDRYMYLAVPPDDFPDAKVSAAVDEVVAGAPGAAVGELMVALVDAAEPIIDKLRRVRPADGVQARALLPFFARVAASAPNSAGFTGSSSRRAFHAISKLLPAASVPDPGALIDELLVHLRLNDIADAIIHAKPEDPAVLVAGSDLDRLRSEAGDRLFACMESAAAVPPSQVEIPCSWTVDQWVQLAGPPDGAREWVRAQVERGNWPAEDVVAFYLSYAIYSNGVEVLSGVDLQKLEAHLGIDWVLGQFTPVASGRPLKDETRDTSFAERRRWAHDVLAREMTNRRPPAASSES